jgi:hypothetical protein
MYATACPPQIIDCLLPAACRRTDTEQERLVKILQNLHGTPTGSLSNESIQEYAAAMCSTGYEGGLSGLF